MSIAAIILAAGRSRRMEAQKLLLPWRGTTIIEHVVDQMRAVGVQHVFVVIGGDADADTAAIEKALNGRSITIVRNPDRDAEMLSSVRCGLKALPGECDAAIISPGDQVAISSQLIAKLVDAFKQSGGDIVLPVYEGTRGHPTIVAAKYFEEILTQHDGVGLRGLMLAHPDDIQEIAVEDSAVTAEMNCPDDYQRQLEVDRARHITQRESSD